MQRQDGCEGIARSSSLRSPCNVTIYDVEFSRENCCKLVSGCNITNQKLVIAMKNVRIIQQLASDAVR